VARLKSDCFRFRETFKLLHELFRLVPFAFVEGGKLLYHRYQVRYLRARIRWIIGWRVFIHNLMTGYSLPDDGQSNPKTPIASSDESEPSKTLENKGDDERNKFILTLDNPSDLG
jgi:hypothetical protein